MVLGGVLKQQPVLMKGLLSSRRRRRPAKSAEKRQCLGFGDLTSIIERYTKVREIEQSKDL